MSKLFLESKRFAFAVVAMTSTAALGQAQTKLLDLDADGNGLYSDAERVALLDELKRLSPNLKGEFDHNGDGVVTVAEQTEGRHPLSQLIEAESITSSQRKIPWSPDIFSEWISNAYFQEEASEGRVASHPARGTVNNRDAKQEDPKRQPLNPGNGQGVVFEANSGQQLSMLGHKDARWAYRWCIFTFRVDGDSGRDQSTVMLDLNRGRGSLQSSPKVWFDKKSGLNVQFVGLNQGGLDRRVMSSKDVIADGQAWNVLVFGIRYGQMYAVLNGRALQTDTPQPPRFSGERPPQLNTYLGDESDGNIAWAYDGLVMGLTEPSEAMVRKMTGWAAHRVGTADRLPSDHPYRDQRPVLDEQDFPHRYFHDDEKWTAWGNWLKRENVIEHAGGSRRLPKGYERVFFDDFRQYRISRSASGEGDLWTGQGFNTAVGMAATLIDPGRDPDAYPYDAEKQLQTLSLVAQGDGDRFRGSAIYTVNDMGHGYTWEGPKIFRIRCMFPEKTQENLSRGLFPAFWSYGTEFLFWRTSNRIENDWFEFEGTDGYYLNGIASHIHYAHQKNIFALRDERYKSYKVNRGRLTEEDGKIPGGLWIWDGQFHTWEFVVDDKWTVVYVSLNDENGRERWVEVCRAPTVQSYLERQDLQLDYAMKPNRGVPANGERQDFVVDWVEVLQQTKQIESVPTPFTKSPRITGQVKTGQTVTCEPHLDGITDVRYYWFADGYPLTWGPSNEYVLTEAEEGKAIRCMVKAVGAIDMPEAWSNVLK